MRAALIALVALCLLGLSGCCADGSCGSNAQPALGVSPIVPHQIEGGSGWR